MILINIYFLGPSGSHSHGVALEIEKQISNNSSDFKIQLLPCPNFDTVFQKLNEAKYQQNEQEYNFAVVPIENSTAGDVFEVMNNIVSGEYQILNEIIIPIKHYFAFHKNCNPQLLDKIYLHPQAKMQCSEFLKKLENIEQIIAPSTSFGAEKIHNENDPEVATKLSTICSQTAIEIYNLKSDMVNVADNLNNFTRFLLIQNQMPNEAALTSKLISILKLVNPKPKNKISLIVELAHKIGSLADLLNSLKEQGASLTKIELRPIQDQPWNYKFLVEFELSPNGEILDFNKLSTKTSKLTVIGSY